MDKVMVEDDPGGNKMFQKREEQTDIAKKNEFAKANQVAKNKKRNSVKSRKYKKVKVS